MYNVYSSTLLSDMFVYNEIHKNIGWKKRESNDSTTLAIISTKIGKTKVNMTVTVFKQKICRLMVSVLLKRYTLMTLKYSWQCQFQEFDNSEVPF